MCICVFPNSFRKLHINFRSLHRNILCYAIIHNMLVEMTIMRYMAKEIYAKECRA